MQRQQPDQHGFFRGSRSRLLTGKSILLYPWRNSTRKNSDLSSTDDSSRLVYGDVCQPQIFPFPRMSGAATFLLGMEVSQRQSPCVLCSRILYELKIWRKTLLARFSSTDSPRSNSLCSFNSSAKECNCFIIGSWTFSIHNKHMFSTS